MAMRLRDVLNHTLLFDVIELEVLCASSGHVVYYRGREAGIPIDWRNRRVTFITAKDDKVVIGTIVR